MVRLGINENVISAGEMQRPQAVLFGHLQPESFRVELFSFSNIARRESAECLAVF